MRADQLLVERGLAATRSQAQRLIASGLRWRDARGWHSVAKNGDEVPEAAELELLDDAEARYVSRGGLKLEGALRAAAVDPRGLDADALRQAGVEPGFDLAVGDLSFISSTLVLPAIAPLLSPGGQLLLLAKPQFELQPGQLGKGGIVRDASLYAQVEQRLRDACAACGLEVLGWFDSPIAGGDGNREFFIHARRGA